LVTVRTRFPPRRRLLPLRRGGQRHGNLPGGGRVWWRQFLPPSAGKRSFKLRRVTKTEGPCHSTSGVPPRPAFGGGAAASILTAGCLQRGHTSNFCSVSD
ncbi:unnamed protein product, partial [Phaeothamnion confervicola]